jgi:hypothetical protein
MGIMRDLDNIARLGSYINAGQTARNTRRIADALDPDGARRRRTGMKVALWFLGISALFLAVVIALIGSSPPDDVPIGPALTPITSTQPALPLPYSPSGCAADGHPWCSNPTATENPEGTTPMPAYPGPRPCTARPGEAPEGCVPATDTNDPCNDISTRPTWCYGERS